MKTMRFFQFFVIMSLVLMTLSPISVNAQSSQVLYVLQGGQTTGLCDSWANACELQYALTSAVSGQEIWVAAGVYKPGTARTDTFHLKSGVGLYGGFAGTETTRDERDWEANKTILSGDIDNNDINDDGNFIAETTTEIQGENAYHVVTGSNTDNTAVLDGFIINAGQANDGENFPNYHGGGMYSENGNPTLMNITFSANLATFGGGISNYYGSPTLSNVIFSGNSAASYGGNGGGISNIDGNPTLTNIIFFNNSADSYGGGIYGGGNLTLTNATFYENSARSGGGVYNSSGSLILKNIQFLKNSAISWGGGMYVSTSNLALTGGIFLENYADQGGGLMNHYSSTTQLTNVTFSTNSAADGGGIFNDTYSNLSSRS